MIGTTKKIWLLVVWFMWSLLSYGIVNATSIWDIDLKFCNISNETWSSILYTKNLQLRLDEWQEWNICMYISNTSNEDIKVKIWFVDGTISNDFDQKKVCKNEWDNANFWKFITINSDSVVVPADWSVTKNAKIKFPQWYAGMVHGCVTYYITTTNQVSQWSSSFDILVRKASFVDVLVSWNFDLWLEFLELEKISKFNRKFFEIVPNDKIKVFENELDKKLTVKIWLRNVWRINQNVNIIWKITNFLWYEKVFETWTRIILWQDEVLIPSLIDDLPFYKWPFDIKYEVSYTPDFEFETDKISSDMRQTLIVFQESKVFFIPWLVIVTIILFIALIVIFIMMRIRHHKKKLQKVLHEKSFYLPYDNKKMPTKKVVKKAPAKKTVKKAVKKVAKKAPAKKAVKKTVKKAVKKVAKKK